MGAAVHADSAGPVGTASHRNAEALQRLRYTAEGPRDPGRDLGRAHALAAHHGAEIGVTKLGEKLRHRPPALGHVAKLPALIPRKGETGGKLPKAPVLRRNGLQRHRLPGREKRSVAGSGALRGLRTQAFKSLYGCHGLFAGADTNGLRQGEAAGFGRIAHIGADENPVLAGLQHPGGAMPAQTAVIIGGQKGERKIKTQRLRIAGREQLGFPEADQDPGGLPERPLGGTCVDLDNLFAGDEAGVADRDRERDRLRRMGGEGLGLHTERCIGKAEAEGIEHVFRAEGLKIAVADVEVLCLDVFGL